jgi:hypothetical protein
MITHGWPRAHRAALVALALAWVALVATAVEAFHLQAAPAPTRPHARPLSAVAVRTVPVGGIGPLPGADPFDRARVEADVLEESAGEIGALPAMADGTAAAARPAVRLQGVVLRGDGGGVAALSVAGGAAQLVRVGQHFQGWQLQRIAPGRATLTDGDTVVVLRVGAQAEHATP